MGREPAVELRRCPRCVTRSNPARHDGGLKMGAFEASVYCFVDYPSKNERSGMPLRFNIHARGVLPGTRSPSA